MLRLTTKNVLACESELKASETTTRPGRPNRESVQGLVRTCLETCAVDLTEVCSPASLNERSMHLGLSTGLATDLETGWIWETKSRRDKCSKELRKTEGLRASPLCSLFMTLQNHDDESSIPTQHDHISYFRA